MAKMNKEIVLRGRTYVDAVAVRELLGLPDWTFYQWKKRGLLPEPIKLGRHRFYEKDELEARLLRGE